MLLGGCREDQLRVLLCPALSRVNSNSKYTEGMQYASNVCVRNSNLLAFPRGLGNFSPPAGHPLRAERQPDQPDQSQPSRSGSLPTYGVAPWKEECPPGPEGGLAGTLSIAPFPMLPSPPSLRILGQGSQCSLLQPPLSPLRTPALVLMTFSVLQPQNLHFHNQMSFLS